MSAPAGIVGIRFVRIAKYGRKNEKCNNCTIIQLCVKFDSNSAVIASPVYIRIDHPPKMIRTRDVMGRLTLNAVHRVHNFDFSPM